MRRAFPHVLGAATFALGCASTSPEPAFQEVSAMVERRTGRHVEWNQGGPEDRKVAEAIHRKLSGMLTLDAAVEIALLQNRGLLATYEELSVSQADLVQAGLLKNPTLSVGVTTAEADRLDPNLVFGIAQDFFDLLMIPARKKIARAQLQATELRVGEAILALASDVRAAFFDLLGAMQIAEMRRAVTGAAQASAELARRQHDAGNISDLVLSNELAMHEQMKLDVARADADVLMAREKLTRLMGAWGDDTGWRVSGRLPALPKDEIALEHLESLAVRQRLDLLALHRDVQVLAYARSVMTSARWVPALGVGLEVARLTEGRVAFGPNGSIELPIFDQKQAAIAKIEAMLRQSEHRAAARAIEIRSEVRSTRDRVIFARRIVDHYRTVLVPLRERIVALSQQEYDAMLLGVYQLLLAKQAETNAYREYIEAVRDYWVARSDLERAVGGRLARNVEADATGVPAVPAGAADAPSVPPPPAHRH